MSIFSIAYNNFKNNIKVYGMFFISMIFSVAILSNLFILIQGEAFSVLGAINENNTKVLTYATAVVLIIFMIFFIWYATNIFLKNRKKEIGIYTFMGIDSYTTGKIYFVEVMLIGITSCLLGIGIGVLSSKLFQMIIFKFAGFNIDIKFNIEPRAILLTVIIFMLIFLFMSIKGFINIIKSNVIELLNANKKQEKMPKINFIIYLIAFLSLITIGTGYRFAVTTASSGNVFNAFKALVLVLIGTYGLFGSVIPIIFKLLIKNKNILYKGENIITINNLAYRLRKNSATYATIAGVTACAITVLGTAASMKTLYDNAERNAMLYTFAFASEDSINTDSINNIISKVSKEKYVVDNKVLIVDSSENGAMFADSELFSIEKLKTNVLPYSEAKEIFNIISNKKGEKLLDENELKDNNAIYLERPGTLLSLASNPSSITIGDINLEVLEYTRTELLGTSLNNSTLIVSDDMYNNLKTYGKEINFYGVKYNDENSVENNIENITNELESAEVITDNSLAYYGAHDLDSVSWLKIVYAIGAFLFLVFILADGSIIYMKIYSDANEDKEKYNTLLKIGADKKDISKVINREVMMFYVLPLIVGAVHSFFAIKVLSDFMSESLFVVYLISLLVCIFIFGLLASLCISTFKMIIKIK